MNTALALLKARLGISTTVRDSYLLAILKGLINELQSQHGIKFDYMNNEQLLFLVDYASYRYENRDQPNMPRHLQWRLHNLVIKYAKNTIQ